MVCISGSVIVEEQTSPRQNEIVSPGDPIFVIFKPVALPSYQRIAGYFASENSEYVSLLKKARASLPGLGH